MSGHVSAGSRVPPSIRRIEGMSAEPSAPPVDAPVVPASIRQLESIPPPSPRPSPLVPEPPPPAPSTSEPPPPEPPPEPAVSVGSAIASPAPSSSVPPAVARIESAVSYDDESLTDSVPAVIRRIEGFPDPRHDWAIEREAAVAAHRHEAFEDRLLALSSDPAAERLLETLLSPVLGRALTDAELTTALGNARARRTAAADERVLSLFADPAARHELDDLINPDTGVAYTDRELDAARVRASSRRAGHEGVPFRTDFTRLIERTAAEYPEATRLLATGNYDRHILAGSALDMTAVEAALEALDGEGGTVLLQDVLDPVVADKPTTIDEYAVDVNLPEGLAPEALLRELAIDMDGVLGGPFGQRVDFRNLGDGPEPGQVIDIDVRDVYDAAVLGWIESPFNAPVVIAQIESNRLRVQTIELDGTEHVLHGTREWGFEEGNDGSTRFYTRGISVEDIFATRGFAVPVGAVVPGAGILDPLLTAELPSAQEGEFALWNDWTEGVGRIVEERGGSVVADSRVAEQAAGPSGREILDSLAPERQARALEGGRARVDRLVSTLERERDALIAGYDDIPGVETVSGHQWVSHLIESGAETEAIVQAMDSIADAAAGSGHEPYEAVLSISRISGEVRSLDRRAAELRAERERWQEFP